MPTTDRVFRRKVQAKYPEIAKQIVRKPLLSDVNDIDNLFSIYTSLVRLSEKPKSSEIVDFRTLFLVIVLKFYDPDYVDGFKKKAMDGIRGKIASLFDVDLNYVSVLFSTAISRVQTYKEITDSADRIYNIIKNKLGER
jgi:hypothetical protein